MRNWLEVPVWRNMNLFDLEIYISLQGMISKKCRPSISFTAWGIYILFVAIIGKKLQFVVWFPEYWFCTRKTLNENHYLLYLNTQEVFDSIIGDAVFLFIFYCSANKLMVCGMLINVFGAIDLPTKCTWWSPLKPNMIVAEV